MSRQEEEIMKVMKTKPAVGPYLNFNINIRWAHEAGVSVIYFLSLPTFLSRAVEGTQRPFFISFSIILAAGTF